MVKFYESLDSQGRVCICLGLVSGELEEYYDSLTEQDEDEEEEEEED